MYIQHTLVAVEGLEQVVIKLTVQDATLHMVTETSNKKKSVDEQLFRINHVATKSCMIKCNL